MAGSYPTYTYSAKSLKYDIPERDDIWNGQDGNDINAELIAHQGVLITHTNQIAQLEDQAAFNFADSIVSNLGIVTLVGDVPAPGNSSYYGTNSSGTRGFYTLPNSMVYPPSGVPVSTGSSWSTSLVGASGQYVAGNATLRSFPTDLGSFTNNPGYLTVTSATATLVPYTGAVSNVTLGSKTITAGSHVTVGGTSSQFTKGDGSLDGNTYLTGITSGLVTGALGYTPYNSTNPNSYISGITSLMVTTALGYTPYNNTNPNGYISSINSSMVTTALGYTPYNSSNPSNYITLTSLSAGVGISYNNTTGVISSSGGTVTYIKETSPNSTLTISASPITASGTITADINLGNPNSWTGTQSFLNVYASGTLTTLYNTLDNGSGGGHFAGGLTTQYNTLDDGIAGSAFFNKNVGIGTASPAAPLNVVTNLANTGLYFDAYASNPNPAIVFRAAEGTSVSPSALLANDSMASFAARGYGTTSMGTTSKVSLGFFASQTWTDAAQGTYMAFATTPNNSTTRSEVMRIANNGGVGIGVTTPPANGLQVLGAAILNASGIFQNVSVLGVTASGNITSTGSILGTNISGNTGTLGTTSGSLPSGHFASFDSHGNLVDSNITTTTLAPSGVAFLDQPQTFTGVNTFNSSLTVSGLNPLYLGSDLDSYIIASATSSADIKVMTNTLGDSSTGGTLSLNGPLHVRTFTTSGTFTPGFSGVVNVLVVAGGGGGGTDLGGGGGAGGVISNTSYSVTSNNPVTVTIGNGGASDNNGGNSVFGSLTAIGGGKGGNSSGNGGSGGSGGGGGGNQNGQGAAGTVGQGNAGGNGIGGSYSAGGGGGAGAIGGNASSGSAGGGGNGYASSISGASVTYAGGGGGNGYSGTGVYSGPGGSGGGGAGNSGGVGFAATGYGSGGGGGAYSSSAGGAGSSGIVIVSYTPSGAAETARFTTGGNFLVGTTSTSLPGTNNIEASGIIRSDTLISAPSGVIPAISNLSSNGPVYTSGSNGTLNIGTISGNTHVLASTLGSLPSGHLAAFDQNSNLVDSAIASGNVALLGSNQTFTGINTFNGPGYTEFSNSVSFTNGTGGTVTSYVSNGTTYKVHTFTSSGTFVAPIPSTTLKVLVVAGGGGSGGSAYGGGAGGGGGVVEAASYSSTSGQNMTVTVGAGGPAGTNGSNSVFDLITAIGGGCGNYTGNGTAGGCGGSGSGNGGASGGSATQGNSGGGTGYGYAGGAGGSSGGTYWSGGGGGAGGVGQPASGTSGVGGIGHFSSISGTNTGYAGGGGGAGNDNSQGSATSGGGIGGVAGTANTGGGAGGGRGGYAGGGGGTAGGSGIVIVSYAIPNLSMAIYSTGAIGLNSTLNSALFTIGGLGNTSGTTSMAILDASGIQVYSATDDGSVSASGVITARTGYAGSSKVAGIATLSSGAVTVYTSSVTNNSSIMLSYNTKSAVALGSLYVSAISPNYSFTITSTGTTDNSTVSWFLIN